MGQVAVDDILVRLSDGVVIETETFGTVRCDPRKPSGDLNVITHAHGDHLPKTLDDATICCSSLTAELAHIRRDLPSFTPACVEGIRLLNSGHIEGSRAVLIEDGDVRILYTGDLSIRDRYGLDGFSPVSADVLIIESTYGTCEYAFPTVEEIENDVAGWLNSHSDRPIVLFAYALGKAQRLLHCLAEIEYHGPVYVSKGIRELNRTLGYSEGVPIPTTRYEPGVELGPSDVLILPSQVARFEWAQTLVSEADAITAGFSGWAAESSYIYRRGLDEGFTLSDHCDCRELIDVVDAIDPERTYTHHGFASELAAELTKQGFDARALRRNQSTLDSFSSS